MSRPSRGRAEGGALPAAVLAVALGALILVGSLAGLAAAAVRRGGVVTVAVQAPGPGGSRMAVVLPGALASLAPLAVPALLPDEAAAGVRPHAPLLRVLAERIETLPDAVFVAVDGSDSRVRVAVRRGALSLEVDDGDGRVRISVPLPAVRHVLTAVARAAERRR